MPLVHPDNIDKTIAIRQQLRTKPIHRQSCEAMQLSCRTSAAATHLSRNLQSGASEADSSTPQIAEITIYHSAEYQTALFLPLLDQQD